MIKFYNNIEDEKFMAIVGCLQKVKDIEYEGYDTSDPLDEMNDFMNNIFLLTDNMPIYCWFSEIYDNWMYSCCDYLSVETINKSFEAALNGKYHYDAGGFLDGWDKDLVEYVLAKKEDFVILNDEDDYELFYKKYEVTVKCPSGYYWCNLDLWRPYEEVEFDVIDCMKDSVMNDYSENDDGDYEDYDGNVIDVEEEAKAYAESWLASIDYGTSDIAINYY